MKVAVGLFLSVMHADSYDQFVFLWGPLCCMYSLSCSSPGRAKKLVKYNNDCTQMCSCCFSFAHSVISVVPCDCEKQIMNDQRTLVLSCSVYNCMSDRQVRLISEMTYNMLMGDIKP